MPNARKKDVDSLLADADFLRFKLEESRAGLECEPLVIPYDHGGGQSGMRKNPAFDAYEAMLKSFCQVVRTLKECGDMPKEDDTVVKFEQFAKSMRKHA